jgi:hypothetical protein
VQGKGGGAQMDPQGGRSAGLGRTVKAVFWSFFGVRRRRDLEADASDLNPVLVIAVALGMAALFAMLLIGIVHWVAH